ncbi:MerR family DNA-binding protein [Neisseria animalis]|uniref:MerR family transcriptional regulator n=1 Tax=Neisseria animalis TaxID=492 RepID=A0A5P3MP16_NEIAN|nr:MerR family DNA-binding protein [Neisseria animalis]QEY23238.1 MerR family transcriptional regulator [Neisseria animalis]ROW32007.1 MerR family transcriptional regulator [Neisseria animalis]VEE08463.1 MerR family transcriptional regulator [Neisseria animalis]
MNISQAAQTVGLSAKQIRDYEKIGLIRQPSRGANGYRLYQESDIKRLHFICHARQVGFPLHDIKDLLALSDNPNRTSEAVKSLTGRHIARLHDEIAKMQAMLRLIEGWYHQCSGSGISDCPILDGLAAPVCAGRNDDAQSCKAIDG